MHWIRFPMHFWRQLYSRPGVEPRPSYENYYNVSLEYDWLYKHLEFQKENHLGSTLKWVLNSLCISYEGLPPRIEPTTIYDNLWDALMREWSLFCLSEILNLCAVGKCYKKLSQILPMHSLWQKSRLRDALESNPWHIGKCWFLSKYIL